MSYSLARAFLLRACLAFLFLGIGEGAATAASFPFQSSEGLKLTIPINAASYDVLPFWMALDEKLFARYGIDASSEGIMQSAPLVAGMVSGDILFEVGAPDAAVNADLNGGDIVILTAGPQNDYAIYATPGIRDVAGLKGKRIGVTGFGTSTDFITRYVLRHAGLDPDHDATLIPVGSGQNRIAALTAGAIDAVEISSVLDQKQVQGFTVVADQSRYPISLYVAALIGRKSWIAAHRNDTLNVVRGYVAGVAAVLTDNSAAMATLGKYMKTSDPAILDYGYRAISRKLNRAPVPEAAALRNELEASKLPAAKTADPAAFIDPSFVEELDRDGFIASLYR